MEGATKCPSINKLHFSPSAAKDFYSIKLSLVSPPLERRVCDNV